MQNDKIVNVLISIVASFIVSFCVAVTLSGKSEQVSATNTNTNINVDKAIEDYLMNNPSIIRKTLELAAQQERVEAEKRIAENYKKHIDELHNTDNSPFVGPKDAKITIVEFFDFNCGYCKRLAPTMMKIIKANPDVRVIMKPVAFLAPSSQSAAKALLAANAQGKFINLYEGLLTHNGQITEDVIDEKIKASGLDVAKTRELMKSSDIEKKFGEITELSRNVEVSGVPTMIINGTPLRAYDQEQIQRVIDSLK